MFVAALISSWLFFLAGLAVAVLSLWALFDCVRRPAERFSAFGKLTKGAWAGILTAATLITVFGAGLGIAPVLRSGFMAAPGSTSSLFTLAAAIAAGVYLADVRPTVSGKGSSWY